MSPVKQELKVEVGSVEMDPAMQVGLQGICKGQLLSNRRGQPCVATKRGQGIRCEKDG